MLEPIIADNVPLLQPRYFNPGERSVFNPFYYPLEDAPLIKNDEVRIFVLRTY